MKHLFFLFIIFLHFYGFSQVADTTTSKELDEVRLDVKRYSKSEKDNTVQTISITQKDIEFSNYQNTADMLANSGKLAVQKSQQGGGSPIIRGFEANRILLLIDGVRMNNLIFRSGHLQNSITIDENMLESTDILFGAMSTPFGSDAIGGAINFVTKKPTLLSENKKEFSAHLNARYSSVNKEKSNYIDFSFSQKKWATLTSFSYNDFGDLKMGSKKNGENDFFGERLQYVENINGVDKIVQNDNPLVQRFSGYKQYNVMQKVLYKPNEKTEHSLNFQFSTTSNIPRYDRLTDQRANKDLRSAVWNIGPQKRLLAGYKLFKSIVFLNSDLTLNANYQNIEESRITRNYKSVDQSTRLEQVAVYSLNIDLKTTIGKGTLIYGTDTFFDNLKSAANKLNIVTNVISPTDTRYPDGNNYSLKNDAFATYSAKFNNNYSYNFGARAGYSLLYSQFVDKTFFSFPFSDIKQENFTYSFAAGLANNATKNIKISFNIASGFRAPNVDDVSKVFESVGGQNLIVPNPNLKPEKNITTDFNISFFNDKNFEFQNTVFYTRLYDAIVTDNFNLNGRTNISYNGLLTRVTANQNLGIADVFGYSNSLKITLTKLLKFYGNFNFTYGRVENKNQNTTVPLNHIPPIYGKVGLTIENKWINIDVNMLYNGKKSLADYSPSGEDNLIYAPKNGIASWQTYNIKTGIKFTKNIMFYSGLENILDIQYRTFASGINAPGRNLYFGAKLNI